ncbi:ATP-dependent DNA helicase RecG [Coxiella endosymbiont of Ornithodoros amblus]|uniref:ATP-dependent DNA helicase RecG n=1 Tax=Coxiella endosymbiont of Ornithodoros amblus TaxID=1656166 RepID=UPI00244DF1CB|nr:ATP-dependent DNA helicase RecG [Coxiella endosymbiont of Ornithodoros amblus]MBW5802831.1 ATP-dependent DNA helicase RecG [Coxiella endosymbiont of Ornithodoros amblus]
MLSRPLGVQDKTEQMISTSPVTALKQVGSTTRELLANLNIHTIQDLLFHLPSRYQDRTRVTAIGTIRHGDQVVVEGKIQLATITYGGPRNLMCSISDGTGSLILRFYHFNYQQQRQLKMGLRVHCFGNVRRNYQGRLEMIHPEYRIVDESTPLIPKDRLTPIYPTTKGLPQTKWRHLINQSLNYLKYPNFVEELLPEEIRTLFRLPTLTEALFYVHSPPHNAPVDLLQVSKHPSQQRLAFEELVAQQLGLQQWRLLIRTQPAPVLIKNNWQEKLKRALTFELTSAQKRVIGEINQDLSKPKPMLRLLQGDVGSGKTIMAAMAILKAVENGYQSAIMVPTELLVEQHYQVFQRWFSPLGISVGWLAGSLKPSAREKTLQEIASGQLSVIIGTHALFQVAVTFQQLALIVIDEQHRFGVHQRLALKEKATPNYHPHQLIMTATPIPRTLAMTAYADLDFSIIDEQPSGRKPITTVLISNSRRGKVIERIKKNCEQGKQVYWVCTLITDSEVLQCETAEATFKKLQQSFTNLSVGLIHGRLTKEEKDIVMGAFKKGDIDLLVSTTVIEVGVDVPNASLIVIENSERLGLTQIHQLRGRVRRGEQKSYCVLLYQEPLSKNARARLTLLRDTQDGFLVAKKDLELRGPGELLGARQSGLFRFRIADVVRHQHLLPAVRKAAFLILQGYSEFTPHLLNRWLKEADKVVQV